MENGKESKEVNIGLVDRPVPPVRDHFDQAELDRLAESIRDNGILVPLLCVRRKDRYEIIDGDRRLQAAWQVGLRQIPIMVSDLSDEQVHLQRMLANLDRHDPDPVSEAKYIARLIHDETFTIEQLSEKLGRSMDWIEGRLMIAEMPDYMQEALSQQAISLGVSMEIFQVKDEATRERYFREALRNGMTVHAAKVNRLMVNEAIESLQERGEEITEDKVPEVQRVPNVHCALTGEVLPVTATRLVRVGIDNFERWRKEVSSREGEIVPS